MPVETIFLERGGWELDRLYPETLTEWKVSEITNGSDLWGDYQLRRSH
jgi:hypothetical protein